MIISIILLPFAYLLGSIPTSVWLGKATKGIDLREHGSGNAGTSNAIRILGWPTGVVVLIFDVLKGYLAVSLAGFQSIWNEGSEAWMILKIVLGVVAVVGHIYPVFAGFRGGKGVATIAGVGFALNPLATLAAMGIYIIVLLIFKISSLGSLSAGLSYPFWVIFVFDTPYNSLLIFSILVTFVLILTHQSNIRRLIKGEENSLNKKKRKTHT